MTKVISQGQPIISSNPTRSQTLPTNCLADTQIRALGCWNQQLSESKRTRLSGRSSFSLLKVIMTRNLS